MKITHQKHGEIHFIRVGNLLTLSMSRPRRRLTHAQREARLNRLIPILCLLALPFACLAGIHIGQFLFTLI